MGISLRFPIQRTIAGGVMASTETTEQAIRTNLIFLLTTKPGNRVMRETFVSPIYNYIMEPYDEISEEALKEEIKEKIYDILPEVNVLAVRLQESDSQENAVSVSISYSIETLGTQDTIKLIIPTQEP